MSNDLPAPPISIKDREAFLHAAIYNDDFLTSLTFSGAPAKARTLPYQFGSELRIPLTIIPRLVAPFSEYEPRYTIPAPAPAPTTLPVTLPVGYPYIIKTALTGAFVTAGLLPEDRVAPLRWDVNVQQGDLLRPNDLRLPPEPSATMRIPTDSPRVLVGVGKLQSGATLMHEQFWKRSATSYSLAPGQRKTVVFDQVSGVTEMSSTTDEIAASLGLSAGGGLGPISASLSATLSVMSSSTSARTLQRQTTNSIEDVLLNEGKDVAMIIQWELTDIYVIVDASQKMKTIESTQAPPLIAIYPGTTQLGCPGQPLGKDRVGG